MILTCPKSDSVMAQLSMKVCAIVDKLASTISDLLMSNTNSGFLMIFTQNLKFKLQNINICCKNVIPGVLLIEPFLPSRIVYTDGNP